MSKKPGTITRVARFRVDYGALTPAQKALFARHVGASRQAWNWATARWHDWQENLQGHVRRLAIEKVGPHAGMSQEELLDAAVEVALLVRGSGDRKQWRSEAYAQARLVHGESKWFQDGYTLASLYRLQAENPESPLHWWYAEGRDAKRNGVPKHGVSTFAYQTALSDFAKAVAMYWKFPKYCKSTGRRLGAPRFKHKSDDGGFALMNVAPAGTDPWRIIEGGHRIVVPNIGSVRLMRNHRPLRRFIKRGGRPTSARFTQHGGKWYVSINVAFPANNPVVAPKAPTRTQLANGTAGVDLGVNSLATLHTGEQIPNPRRLKAAMAELRRLQRKRDRQHRAGSPDCFDENGVHKKGVCHWGAKDGVRMSRSASTTQRQIKRLHAKLAAQRAGYLHEVTKMLAASYAQVGIEDLNVSGMTGRAQPKSDPDNEGGYLPNRRKAKSGLNRAILDAGFGEFRRQLEYKTGWYGSNLILVDRYAPTSKTCSNCGTEKANLSLSERTYTCGTCGLVMDRDHNAARNIRALALQGATPTESQHPAGAGVADKRGLRDPSAEKPVAPDGVAGCKTEGQPSVNEAREGPPTPNTTVREDNAA